MIQNRFVSIIIPAYNEEDSISNVLKDIPDFVDEIILVDNASTDNTSLIAAQNGAKVIREEKRGYGKACLSGIANLEKKDIIVFLDADYSDYPDELPIIIDPILNDSVDIVIGSRTRGKMEEGAMPLVARFGNWLAPSLIKIFWNVSFSDLGPFRAITFNALNKIKMKDEDFGWTVEMQIKAAKLKLPYAEVPVSYRKRIGRSKISGTVLGSIKAGTKILYLIFKNLFKKDI